MRLLFFLLGSLVSFTATASVALPIEVLGTPGHVETVTLNVPAGASTVTGLKLKIHGLTFENKASVKINDSAWFELNDQSVEFPQAERAFWGMGGILGTLKMVLPIPSQTVRDGTNTLHFRFNDLDGKTTGYRVLALNFLATTEELIPASEFTEEDPRSWKPPIETPEAISEGKILWYSAPLAEGTTSLRVNCGDCHAHDGRDLKYFNYSNKSIIERSIFHHLTRREAEKIASYIRSLDVPYEDQGRPWNPPYQPGPGLDAKPIQSWAAGAGLEWVLENDLETLRHIFPNGPTAGSIEFTNTLNAREILLVVQLPDWNHWLPSIHPNDALPDIFPAHEFVQIHQRIRSQLEGKTGLAAAKVILAQRSNWDRAENLTGLGKRESETPAGIDYAYRRKGLAHWRVMKTWELMTEFKAEDVGQELDIPSINDRRWFHGEIFRLSPHIMGTRLTDSWQSESMQWYQLQLVLNDGNRRNGSIVPIDWGYLHALNFSSWKNPARMPTYGIAILNMVKAGEVGENSLPLGVPHSWNPFKQNIYWLAPGKHLAPMFQSIDITLRRKVAEALISPWLDKAESYPRAQYETAGLLTEKLRTLTLESTATLDALGIDPGLLLRMQRLTLSLWPQGVPPTPPRNLSATASAN